MNVPRLPALWLIAFAAVIALVVLLRSILLPFLAGLALAYLLNPVVGRLQKLGLNRALAAFAILALFIVAISGVAILAVPVIGTEIADFIDKVPGYIAQLQALASDPARPWLRKVAGAGLNEAQQSAGEIASLAANWLPSLLSSVWSDSRALFSALSLLVVTPIVTFYLLKDWDCLTAAIERSIPSAHRDAARKLARELDDTVSGFIRGQGTICLILALSYATALRLMDLNHGILIGLFAGLISFIPYLGSLAGLLVSICVAVLQYWPSWTMIPVVAAVFICGQAIADYVLAPYLVASRIHLNPVWVMFAIAAFGYLFGFVGLILAVPLAAAAGVLVRFTAKEYLEGEAKEPPSAFMPQEAVPARKER